MPSTGIRSSNDMEEENFDVGAAMAQIARGICVKIPRLTKDEMELYNRPQKRIAKKRYQYLSFDFLDDDDESFFEITANSTEDWGSTFKKRKRRKRLASDDIVDEVPESSSTSTANVGKDNLAAVDDASMAAFTATSISNTAPASVPTHGKRAGSNSKVIVSKSKKANESSAVSAVIPSNVSSNSSAVNSSVEKPEGRIIVKRLPAGTKQLLKPTTTTDVKILKSANDDAVTYTQPKVPCSSSAITVPCNEIKQTVTVAKTNIVRSDGSANASVGLGAKPNPSDVQNSKIGKIRIKSAQELGSTVIFLDDDEPPTTVPPARFVVQSSCNFMPASNNNHKDVVKPNTTHSIPAIAQSKHSTMNIQLIGDLYTKFFTPKNQVKIRSVAEILQNITDNIKANNDRISEINSNNKLTDAQKLMHRYKSYQDFKRNKDVSERKLREKFELVMRLFDEKNFETLFQLFFLGILKILIVNVSNAHKKGTLFKKLLNVLYQSLTSSKYKNDRVYEILKSRDFRDKCIALVQFIEKYSRTELFGMLFLSDADKKLIKNKSLNNEHSDEDKSSRVGQTSNQVIDKQKDSLLLDLLSKETGKGTSVGNFSKGNNSVLNNQTAMTANYRPTSNNNSSSIPSTVNGMQTNSNVSFGKTASTNNPTSIPSLMNGAQTNSNVSFSNGNVPKQYANNYIFSGGEIKPVFNGAANAMVSNDSSKVNVNVSQANEARRFVNHSNLVYISNTSNGPANKPFQNAYSGYSNHPSGITSNITVRTNSNELNNFISYKNNENIQPGFYINTNKMTPEHLKKVSNIQNCPNVQMNGNGFRCFSSNNADMNENNSTRYVEQLR